MKIPIFKQNFMINKKKVILAVGAHPDDIEFGCPVTLKSFIKQGYEVYYVVATNGENGFKVKSMSSAERIAIRRKEAYIAAGKVGAKKVYFLGFKDGFLDYTEQLRKKLTLLIKALQPEIIFSFDPANLDFTSVNLQHRDHRVIATAVFDSVFAAKNNFIYPHKNGLHRVERIFFFGSNRPDYFVDITKEIDFKLDVLSSFKSQFPNFENFAVFFRENLASHTDKYKYSESFRVIDVIQISY